MRVQFGCDLQVQALHRLQALAPAQRRQQPQHGRCRHTGDGGAERERQAFHRCCERAANGLQIGGALQCKAGALERGHHAEQGAEHAEQHQQADQIRRQHRCRQRHALAPDTQAHRITQAGVYRLQPIAQGRRRRGQPIDCRFQRRSSLAVAIQLQRAGHITGADHRRDAGAERVGAEITDADPANRQQADEKHTHVREF